MTFVVKRKIYVGNLPADCTEERLLEEFEKYGDVAECDVIRNYGFIVSHELRPICVAQ